MLVTSFVLRLVFYEVVSVNLTCFKIFKFCVRIADSFFYENIIINKFVRSAKVKKLFSK